MTTTVSYRDLQKQAKKLGISPVNIPQDELEKQIEAAQESVNGGQESDSPPETSESEEEFNTAVVLEGSREKRRYTLDNHGSEFQNLAKQYAQHRGYRVELTNAQTGIVCPSCGHRFTLE